MGGLLICEYLTPKLKTCCLYAVTLFTHLRQYFERVTRKCMFITISCADDPGLSGAPLMLCLRFSPFSCSSSKVVYILHGMGGRKQPFILITEFRKLLRVMLSPSIVSLGLIVSTVLLESTAGNWQGCHAIAAAELQD